MVSDCSIDRWETDSKFARGVCVEGVQKGCSGKGENEHKGCGESEGASSASVGKRERLQKETENDAICISRLTRAD